MLFNVWTLPNDQGQRAKRETKPNNAFVFSLLVWRRVGFEARVGLSKFANYFSGAGGAASLRDHHLVCPGGDSGISPIVPSLHNERAIYRL